MAERILIQFKAQGDAKLQSSMLKLAATQGLLEKNTREMRLAMTRLTQAFEKTERRSRLLNNSFATMRSKMLLFSFAMSLGGRQLLQFSRNAANIEPMRIAFNNLQGSVDGSTVAMQKLRQATNGTMSEMELLQQANNAMILGITTNSDEMAKMFDMAQRLGEALGIDTRRSVESLITGIGRQSRLMLDNIGIIVDTTKAYEKFAQANQKTVPQLTDLEKKQAFFNATLEAAEKKLNRVGKETDTPIKAFNRLNATIENFTTKIGEDLLNTLTPLINIITLFAERLQNVDFSRLLRSLASLTLAIKFAGASGDAFIITLKKMSAAQISAARVSRILTTSVKRFARASLAFVAFEVLFQAISKAIEFFGKKASQSLNETTQEAEKATEKLSEYQVVLDGFPNTLEGQTQALEYFKKKLKSVTDSISENAPEAAESLEKSFLVTDDSIASINKVFGQSEKLTKMREKTAEMLNNQNLSQEKANELKQIQSQIEEKINQIEAQSAATKAMLIPNLNNEIELLKLKNDFSGTELIIQTELKKLEQKGVQFTEEELIALKQKLQEKQKLINQQKIEISLQRGLNQAMIEGINNHGKYAQSFGKMLENMKNKMIANASVFAIQSFLSSFSPLSFLKPAGGFLDNIFNIFHNGGMIQGYNQGGMIPQYASGGGVDNVPIMAQEGEFVMRRSAVESIGVENLARMNASGQAGVNINFTGNVMSQDFIESEAIPAIKKAVRRGADLGIS